MTKESNTEINPRLVDRLTEALIFAFCIPDGIQLVAILGNGVEDNNRAALKTWVAATMAELEDVAGAAILPVLQDRLSHHLDDALSFG